MIQLTRLNDRTFTLNAFLIEQIEALPDTTITLTNGKKLVVKEEDVEVRERLLRFYRSIGAVRIVEHQHAAGDGMYDVE